MDAATKTRQYDLKATSEKVVHKSAKATSEFIGKKIADKIVKPKPIIDESSRNVEEIVAQKTIQEILNKLRQVLL